MMAQNRRNDLEAHTIMTEEEMDENLTSRLTIQLEGAQGQYDLQKLREAFQSRDKNKTGKLKRVDVSRRVGDGRTEGRTDERTEGRTEGRTDGRKDNR